MLVPVLILLLFLTAPDALGAEGTRHHSHDAEQQGSSSTKDDEATESASTDIESASDIVTDSRSDDPDRADLDDEQSQLVATHMRLALEAEEKKRYDEARLHFVAAYRIFPHSHLLLSVARTADRADDFELAIKGYRRFVERRPDYEHRDDVHIRIETMKLAILLSEKPDKPVAGADHGDQTPRPASDPLPEGTGSSDSRLPVPTFSAFGWSGIAATTLGLSSLLAAGLTASSIDRDFEELERLHAQRNYDQYQQLSGEVDSKQSRGKFLFYGGLAITALGAGAVVYDILIDDAPSSPAAQVNRSQWTVSVDDSHRPTLHFLRSF